MPFLLGTDEAGYGPNLGPLVISASLWEVPAGIRGDDLYKRLQTVIAPGAARSAKTADQRVAIADSKLLYQSGKGLKLLERGLWAAWHLIDRQPALCGDVWRLLTGDDDRPRCEALCDVCSSLPAPRELDAAEADALYSRLCGNDSSGSAAGRSEERCHLSAQVQRHGGPQRVERRSISHWTLQLIVRMIEPIGDAAIAILCDKHGGRDRYLPLLTDHFPGQFIEVVAEGRSRSVYRFGPPERRVEIAFQAKGESHLPTALASMASKYLRELAMQGFNDFWRGHVSDLRPTAGYPLDAKRFKADIAAAQQALGVEDRIVWRTK